MKINGILLRDGSDSETESSIPVLYINSLNKCLSLITGDAEDFMYKISEEMILWPNLKYHVFGSNGKSEHPVLELVFFGDADVYKMI